MSTKNRDVKDVPFDFGPELFKLVDGSLSELYSLQNKNLFLPKCMMFLNQKSVYAQIMPSLLLVFRIILDEPQSFNVFICKKTNQKIIEKKEIIPLRPDKLINIICSYISDLDFDLDMAQRGKKYGMTYFWPNEHRNFMTIDYILIKLVIDKETRAKMNDCRFSSHYYLIVL